MGYFLFTRKYTCYISLILNKSSQLLFLFGLVIFSLQSYSQTKLFLPLTKIETTDGLSSPNVRKILQDSYGFMWFATQDGLNRFDGVKITQYNAIVTDAKHAILGSDVFDIGIDTDNKYLWCLAAYEGLSKIDIQTGIVVAKYPIKIQEFSGTKFWFKCMNITRQSILIGTNEGVVIKFNLKTEKPELFYTIKPSNDTHYPVDKIYHDSNNNVWLLVSNYGIVKTNENNNAQSTYLTSKDLHIKSNTPLQFLGFAILDDVMVICTSEGIRQINLDNMTVLNKKAGVINIPEWFNNKAIYAIAETENSVLLSCSEGFFLIENKTGAYSQIIFSKFYDDKNWVKITNCVFKSGESIWIGSQFGVGWVKNIKTPYMGFFNSMDGSGIKISHSITLCKATDSSLIVCADDGLYVANYFTGVIIKIKTSDTYFHAFKGPHNNIIASGLNTGLKIVVNNFSIIPADKIFPELAFLKNDVLISSQCLDNSIYFLASQNQKGLYIWDINSKKIIKLNTESKPVRLKSNVINRLFLDSKKRLWILCDNVVSIYDYKKGTLENLDLINPFNKEPLSINMDICEINGEFWIASYGTGIVQLNRNQKIKRIFSVNEGLNNLGLYKIHKLNDSMLISSSNNGIYALNITSGKGINYFEEDGLQSNNFEETSGCEDDQYIFLGGINGFTKIDKKLLSRDKKFYELFFSSIQINHGYKITDTLNLLLHKIEVPSNSTQVVVNFSYLDYFRINTKLFRYRLLELNEKWNELARSRSVTLMGTPPGKYTLQVQAANEDGIWSEPKELILVYLPKWYQTWWFKLLVFLSTVGIIYAFYRYRIRQIKKQHEIRKNIATDLHDDLGSTLNSVKVFTNLAISGVKQEESLQQVKDNLTEATMSLRDMIWVLDDSLDTVDELITRLKQFAIPVATASNIETIIKADSEVNSRQLTKEEKRNLFLICKEAINNSIKYSGANKIDVAIIASGKKIQIVVADNGKGFNVDEVKKGYGLKNMQYRAGQIKYKVVLTSSPGNGTQIIILPS